MGSSDHCLGIRKENGMDKNVTVVVAGTGKRYDVALPPGATPNDVLRDLGLEGYSLSGDGSSDTFFGSDEDIYEKVKDGDKVWASTDPKVGRTTLAA